MTTNLFLKLTIASLVSFGPLILNAQTNSNPSDADLNSAIQSLRADVHADRVAIIRSTMQFTPQESDAFWPIYKKYSFDMSKVNDHRVALVLEYASNYQTMTDAEAKSLVGRMLQFEQARLDVQKKYFKEFSAKLSGQTVAKFFQLEHRMDLVIDLELAARLPALLEKPVSQ